MRILLRGWLKLLGSCGGPQGFWLLNHQCETWPILSPPTGAVPQSNPESQVSGSPPEGYQESWWWPEGRLSEWRFRQDPHKFLRCVTARRCQTKIQPRSAPVIPTSGVSNLLQRASHAGKRIIGI